LTLANRVIAQGTQ